MPIDPWLALVGFMIGVSIGLTGVGAGVVLTPFLIVGLHTRPIVAVATASVFAVVTRIAGSVQHLRQRTVDFRVVGLLAAGSLPTAAVSIFLVSRFLPASSHMSDVITQRSIALSLLVVAALMTWRLFGPWPRVHPRAQAPLLVGFGVLLGVMVAVTSVGGGSVAIAGLVLLTTLAMARVVGTDMVHAALLSLVTAPLYLAAGRVNLPLALNLLVGSLPGVILGSRFSARLPDKFIRVTLVLAVWSIAIKLI